MQGARCSPSGYAMVLLRGRGRALGQVAGHHGRRALPRRWPHHAHVVGRALGKGGRHLLLELAVQRIAANGGL